MATDTGTPAVATGTPDPSDTPEPGGNADGAVAAAVTVAAGAPTPTDGAVQAAPAAATTPTADNGSATPAAAETESASAATVAELIPDVNFPYDPGFEVTAAYDGTAGNDAGETAALQIAFGGTHVTDSALPVSTGEVVCPRGPNDATVPISVQVTATGLADTTTVRVAFGQAFIDGADPAAHPMTVQWNHATGPECAPATGLATDPAAAASVWTTLRPSEPQRTTGYLIVANYFDPAAPNAHASAATGVSIVINDRLTQSDWVLNGGDVGVVHDPTYGDYGAVVFG